MKKFKSSLILILFLILTLAGSAYLLFLQYIFPRLVPGYGGGEPFALNIDNNYTYQILWQAYTRLHLTLETDNTVALYSNGEYLCNCTSYNFIIEPEDTLLILMKSNSPVSGRFTAWQEIPPERQTIGIIIILVGLAGTGLLAYLIKKS
jgi:hypothetical protein